MKIAVCDDEKIFTENTIEMIYSLLADRNMCSIIACSSGEEVLEKHRTENFDIIFLDIEMDGISGMEAAREIRKNDSKVIIVFLTNYHEFAEEGYEVGAFRYLVKNQPEYVYEEKFKSILEEYFQNHKMFEVKSKNTTSYLYLNEICYFDVLDKEITVHTMKNKIKYYGKLSDVEEQLKNDELFIKPHKSFLINISKVSCINNNDITMKNGDVVLMSRNCKKLVESKYVAYMTAR